MFSGKERRRNTAASDDGVDHRIFFCKWCGYEKRFIDYIDFFRDGSRDMFGGGFSQPQTRK